MKPTTMAATGLAICLFAGSGTLAHAASMTYCAFYAQQRALVASPQDLTIQQPQTLRERAFYECVNMDDEPPLPVLGNVQSVEATSELAFIDAMSQESGLLPIDAEPVKETEQTAKSEPIDTAGSVAALDTTETEAATTAKDEPKPIVTGLKVGSPEWEAWCSKHYPNSFDPKTGTVLPKSTGRRTKCS